MSTPLPPDPAKLVTGLFTRERRLMQPVFEELSRQFGPIDTVSPWIPFDFTDYYEGEMGGPLYRRMVTFENLVNQGDLADIKRATNRIEQEKAAKGKRRVNIDPGYLLKERFVLGTGKNFTHRIYVGRGIYADLTLVYRNGGFRTLPWTYPDYADDRMIRYLTLVRKKYLADLKNHPDHQTVQLEAIES